MKFFLILGHNPDLSILEFFSYIKKSRIQFETPLLAQNNILILETKKNIDLKKISSDLGGLVKSGRIIQEYADIDDIKPQDLVNLIGDINQTKKFYFGFSNYVSKKSKNLHDLGLKIKNILKTKNLRSRWVTSKEPILSAVIVKKNQLISNFGREFVIIEEKDNKKIYLGLTVAVQEFEEYSYRDYGRPCRDMKVGLLPPKLAKIMINLAGVDKNAAILDPFCGSGTIVQEAILLGYQKIIGSDLNQEMVKAAAANLNWLLSQKNISPLMPSYAPRPQTSIPYQLFNYDVRKISNFIPKNSINAVITEPYLGPIINQPETANKLKKTLAELSSLYLNAFAEFKKILKKDAVIVMIWPAFIKNLSVKNESDQNHFQCLNILDQVEKMGFKNILPESAANLAKLTNRGSIIYFRPGQKVAREIFKYKKIIS